MVDKGILGKLYRTAKEVYWHRKKHANISASNGEMVMTYFIFVSTEILGLST